MRSGTAWRIAALIVGAPLVSAQTTDQDIYTTGAPARGYLGGPLVVLGIASKETRINHPGTAQRASATVYAAVPPGTVAVLSHLTGWELGYLVIDRPYRFFDYGGIQVRVTGFLPSTPAFPASAIVNIDVNLTGRHERNTPPEAWFAVARYQLTYLGRPPR